eukprot:3061090-Pleurochrysis_carterae.AAC.1
MLRRCAQPRSYLASMRFAILRVEHSSAKGKGRDGWGNVQYGRAALSQNRRPCVRQFPDALKPDFYA